jgi:uncharacterized protein DUF928
MKPQSVISAHALAAATLLWFPSPFILGAEPAPTQSASSDTGKSAATPIVAPVYKPPTRGAPGGRVGAGTRGIDQAFTLSVLAPDHTGLTSKDQPVLYWYVSRPLSSPIELTIIENGATPIIEKILAPPTKSGIQRLQLAEHGVHLEPGKQYQWFLTLVSDPKRRAKDVMTGATIERLALSDNLAAQVSGVDRLSAARYYAEAGQWYDAIALLSEQIEANPLDPNPRTQRAGLLQQVGLQEIADYDMNSPGD